MTMQKSMSWFGLVFRVLLLLFVYILLHAFLSSYHASLLDQETNLTVKLTDLHQENTQLEDDIADVGSDQYVQSHARAELHFINPGELSFRFASPDSLFSDTPEESAIREAETN